MTSIDIHLTSLLSIAYLPPVSYILKCIESDEIIIEQHEHFIKQTYRNRCFITGPNGKQMLIIPVVHENIFRTPIKDVMISYSEQWNMVHWKTICTTYRNSPYFEYFEDDFKNIYDNPGKYLFEFNCKLLNLLIQHFNINKVIKLTNSFEKKHKDLIDWRNLFHMNSNHIQIQPYNQVFSERHGFMNDLSAIDYLFNAGPELLV